MSNFPCRAWCTLTGAMILASCGGGREPEGSPEGDAVVVSAVDTVLSSASTMALTDPGPLALAGDGTLLVLDTERGAIFARSPSGQVRSFARAGEGPGELRGTLGMGTWGDTVWVLNAGNGRLELFGLDGAVLGSLGLPPAALNGPADIRRDGQVVAATMGVRDSSLAVVYAPHGSQEVLRLGRLLVPAVEKWNVGGIMAAARTGHVPSMFRNFAQPVFAPDGVWLILAAEGLVQRYDRSGRMIADIRLEGPELERIRADFQEASRRVSDMTSFVLLRYLSSWLAVGDDLWVTLNTGEDEPTTLLVLGRGGIRRRVVFPRIHGVMAMAVDLPGRLLYLAVPTEGLVLRVPLPAGLP